MIEETLTEQPNFFSCEGYTFYYTKQTLRDFNGEFYDINTGLSDSLIENNPELPMVLEYFVELVSHLDTFEDVRDKSLDTLYFFLSQINDNEDD